MDRRLIQEAVALARAGAQPQALAEGLLSRKPRAPEMQLDPDLEGHLRTHRRLMGPFGLSNAMPILTPGIIGSAPVIAGALTGAGTLFSPLVLPAMAGGAVISALRYPIAKHQAKQMRAQAEAVQRARNAHKERERLRLHAMGSDYALDSAIHGSSVQAGTLAAMTGTPRRQHD